jgi:hypothetical protein
MTKARQRERKRRQAEFQREHKKRRQAELQKDEEVDRIFNMLLEARFGRKDRYAGWELDAVCKGLDERLAGEDAMRDPGA